MFQDTVTEYSDDDGHGGAGISEDEGEHTKVFSSAITGRSKCNDKVVTQDECVRIHVISV